MNAVNEIPKSCIQLTPHQLAEQSYFQIFAQHYNLPPGRIEYSDKPDVLIYGERKIGVELAHIYKKCGKYSASEQVQNQSRMSVIKAAERLFLERGGRKIELWIDFDPQYPIQIIDKTANDLANVALEIAGFMEGHTSYGEFEKVPELRFLTHNGKEYADSKWKLLQGHEVPNLSVERVKELVAQKTKKLQNYHPCDAYWLLLVVEFWDPAQDQDIEWPQNESVGLTPFEKILIYKPQFRQVSVVR